MLQSRRFGNCIMIGQESLHKMSNKRKHRCTPAIGVSIMWYLSLEGPVWGHLQTVRKGGLKKLYNEMRAERYLLVSIRRTWVDHTLRKQVRAKSSQRSLTGKLEIQIREQELLVQRLFCGYNRENAKIIQTYIRNQKIWKTTKFRSKSVWTGLQTAKESSP